MSAKAAEKKWQHKKKSESVYLLPKIRMPKTAFSTRNTIICNICRRRHKVSTQIRRCRFIFFLLLSRSVSRSACFLQLFSSFSIHAMQFAFYTLFTIDLFQRISLWLSIAIFNAGEQSGAVMAEK